MELEADWLVNRVHHLVVLVVDVSAMLYNHELLWPIDSVQVMINIVSRSMLVEVVQLKDDRYVDLVIEIQVVSIYKMVQVEIIINLNLVAIVIKTAW